MISSPVAIIGAGTSRTRARIGEAWIDSLTCSEALDAIEHLVASGAGGFVVTPNIDHVVNLERDPALRQAYAAAKLTLVDGKPLVWASRLLGAPFPEKISGADLVPLLLQRAALHHWRLYLLGAGPGVAQEAAEKIAQMGVAIVGTDSPNLSSRVDASESEPVIERIRSARPDLVLVAFGCPKQELWMLRAQDRIRPAVSIGVGITLDFIAGRVKRAPAWMSRSGLEWLFRLSQEPRRLWRRYLVNDPRFLLILLRTLRLPRAQRVRVL
jgi:N-acetylglucosaminyldiphosphoundecaprenol N-acetyl-beta-D-mannosaminyltransferase